MSDSATKDKNVGNAPAAQHENLENIPGLPNDDDVLAKTDVDRPDLDLIGSDTEKLSDVTDENDPYIIRKVSGNKFSTLYRQIQPLIKNKQIRCFSFMNLLLLLINICLVIALLVFAVLTIVLALEVRYYTGFDRPCMYEWSSWSDCSKTCRTPNDTDPPLRYRTVKKDTIVRSRGKYKDLAPCPQNLDNLVDYAPCNTHLCPRKLSSFKLVPISVGDSSTCGKIRDIPPIDMLIQLDSSNLTDRSHCKKS